MTTAASFNTPDRVIREAMYNAGLLQDGDDPSPEQYARYVNKLNDIINLEQQTGAKLWAQVDYAVTLVAGTALYTFGPAGTVVLSGKPVGIIQAYYLDSNSVSRPLFPISRDEYVKLGNKTTQGQLNSYYVDKQQNTLNVYLWNVPDATAALGTLHVILKQEISSAVSLTDTLNFPPEWFLFLQWALAAEICTGQSERTIMRCEQKFAYYKKELEDQDVEDASTTFYPEDSSNASSFR